MALYAASVRTAAAAAATFSGASGAYGAIRPAASDRCFVREIGIFNTVATAISVGLIRATAAGTATTSILGQAQDPGAPAGTVNLDSAFSTGPTIGAATTLLRRFMLPAAIGGGFVMTFGPNDLVVVSGAPIVIVNTTGTGQICDLYALWDE